MDFPPLEIVTGESVFQAVCRLEQAFRARGIQLSGFETLNTSLPISRFANFFQGWVDGREVIFVVMTEEWNSSHLVAILNILLEIRADPDPPGTELMFHFYSAHPVPAILMTLFGDHRIGPLECRAAMVACFGHDLRADDCTRLASVAVHLLTSAGVRTGFKDPEGIRKVRDFVTREIHQLRLPRDGAPLNLLVCLGCLYGEILRSRLGYRTEWAMVKEYQPWPCLVVRARAGEAPSPASMITQNLGFSPIAMVMLLSQDGGQETLEKGEAILTERCRKEFGPPTAPPAEPPIDTSLRRVPAHQRPAAMPELAAAELNKTKKNAGM
jgi:hypothetical protein